MNQQIRNINKPKVSGVFVVDLDPVLRKFNGYRSLYPLYNVFPLQEMVHFILSSHYDQDIIEIMNNEIDRRLDDGNQTDYIDIFMRDIFLENLFEELESYIYKEARNKIDYADYQLDKWAGETTAILVKY